MVIDQNILDRISVQAKANPRLRQSYDLRNSEDDNSQRMLNAMEPGTLMPIHRHMKTSESVAIIRGKLIMRFFDDGGNVTGEYLMQPGGEYPMAHIEIGQWHSLEVLEEGTVVFESKDGKYEVLREEDVMGNK